MFITKNNRHVGIRKNGFTLIEMLIALFIFTLLSTMLGSALHSVINAQSGSEKSAARLRKLQIALLIIERDVEQIVNRPVLNATGSEEAAFIGTAREFTFTHTGFANLNDKFPHSALQRARYYGEDYAVWRMTWAALDQVPQSKPHARRLLSGVVSVSFQYLDKKGRFHNNWPLEGDSEQPLPRAIRVYLTISKWGKLSQLYVIPAQASKTAQVPPAPSQPLSPTRQP